MASLRQRDHEPMYLSRADIWAFFKSSACQGNISDKTKEAKKSSTKTSAAGTSMKVTASEKKLVELYRQADSDTKKAAMSLLKGEKSEAANLIDTLYNGLMKSLKTDK